ncbi:hypothetical protein [Escherichia coli]|uniref:hypothetical protein n=1 Tax=Escherichia coli TaxID=562 RepID=UPI0032DA693A
MGSSMVTPRVIFVSSSTVTMEVTFAANSTTTTAEKVTSVPNSTTTMVVAVLPSQQCKARSYRHHPLWRKKCNLRGKTELNDRKVEPNQFPDLFENDQRLLDLSEIGWGCKDPPIEVPVPKQERQ